MPGPYGVPQMGCGREGQGRAAALPFAVGGGYPKMGSNAQPVGTLQASQARPAPLMGSLLRACARG